MYLNSLFLIGLVKAVTPQKALYARDVAFSYPLSWVFLGEIQVSL